MKSFKTELFKISFAFEQVTITHLKNKTYTDFNNIAGVANFIEFDNSHQFSKKEGLKIISKSAEYFLNKA